MRSAGPWIRVAFLLSSALLAAAPRALAEPVSRGEREYRAVISKALEEFQSGNFPEARALFLQAHALRPSASTLRALGFVEFELRHYVEALTLLESALADSRNRLTDSNRAEVVEAIARVKGFVGRYRLVLEPSSAELSLDGAGIESPGDRPLLLAVGEHALIVNAKGYRAATRSLDVKGGEDQRLTIRLEPDTAASAAASPRDRAAALGTTGTTGAATDGEPGALPWVALVGSGAAVVAGGVLLAIWSSNVDAVEDAPQDSAYRDVRGRDEGAPVLSGVGIGLLGLGAAGTVASLVWLLDSEDPRESSASLHIQPSSVELRATF